MCVVLSTDFVKYVCVVIELVLMCGGLFIDLGGVLWVCAQKMYCSHTRRYGKIKCYANSERLICNY